MLLRTDPFRALDRVTQELFDGGRLPSGVPMDAWREDGAVWVTFDLPGVDPDSVDLQVDHDALTVTAERKHGYAEDAQVLISERPVGTFTRQLSLGEALDADNIEASYDAGVLKLRIPVADKAKPRKIEINGGRKELQS
ncbi:Hsp20/alpha crystallin family protein [Kitasatospora sp. NPDC127111]|uniref:Hsp20/alpha crystallin family protein n=1 Tax=Kitasatospora sp. NPDC127111 TaxID=3345363 RepID=UPI003628A7E3